jgi:hypothetical protein
MEIGSFVQKYNLSDFVIQEMKDNFLVLKVSGFEDNEGYEKVKSARLIVKTKRVEVERKRIELKDESLKYGRAVDAEAKRLTALLLPIEQHLVEQQDVIDKEKARREKEKADQENRLIQNKVNDLLKFDVVLSFEAVQKMPKEEYDGLLLEAMSDCAEKKRQKEAEEAARKAEEVRLNAIKAEQELERKKFEAEKEVERKRLEAEKAEQLKRENAIKAEQEKIEQEKQKIESAKQKAFEDEKRKIELEKAKKEAAERATKEAEEKARQENEAAIRAAQEHAAELKHQEDVKPDKEKLTAFVLLLEHIQRPSIKDSKAVEIMNSANKAIASVCEEIRKNIKTL